MLKRNTWMAVALATVPLSFFGLASSLCMASSAPQVKTHSGTVEGKDDGKVRSFLGIPYAVPPVGELRWKAPEPVAKWSGVRKATKFGFHCMQGDVYGDMVFHDPGRERRLPHA